MSGGTPPIEATRYRDIASGLFADLEEALERGHQRDVTKAIKNLGTLAHLKVADPASIPGFDAWHKRFVKRFLTSSQTQTVTLPEVQSIISDLQQLY